MTIARPDKLNTFITSTRLRSAAAHVGVCALCSHKCYFFFGLPTRRSGPYGDVHASNDSLGSSGGLSRSAYVEPAGYASAAPSASGVSMRPYPSGNNGGPPGGGPSSTGGAGGYPLYGNAGPLSPSSGGPYGGANYDSGGGGAPPPLRRAPPTSPSSAANGLEDEEGYNA